MRSIILLSFAAILSGAPAALPMLAVKDQFDRPLAVVARTPLVLLVYRSREASDRSLAQERDLANAAKGISVIRLVDISRAPFFVHGMIVGQLRTSEPSNACYLDFDGKAALPFGVPDNGVGYFLYTNGALAMGTVFVYSISNMRVFDGFKASVGKMMR